MSGSAYARERLRELGAALRPTSLRGQVIIGVAVTLVVVIVVQVVVLALVERRVEGELERALGDRAAAIALEASRVPAGEAAGVARQADRTLGETRMVMKVDDTVVFWNEPVSSLEARAVATEGNVEVLLERPDPSAGPAGWAIVALVGGGVIIAATIAWLIMSGASRRLRRDVDELAARVEAVAEGDFSQSDPETADELGRLAHAVNDAAGQLARADTRQREFLADAAHELRTPVTAIEGFANALEDGTASTPEDREEAAAYIRSEAERLRLLVERLQELTVLDLDPPVNLTQVDLAELAREEVARLEPDALSRGVVLMGPDGSAPTTTDPDHVRVILENLVANALKATDDGGRIEIAVVARSELGTWELSVSDDGRGVAPEHVPHLFERLYRADKSRDRALGGSGLGLAIVRRRAELLAGSVRVASELGRGSTFTLSLPSEQVREVPKVPVRP
jgi:signal transduction histidine kinase